MTAYTEPDIVLRTLYVEVNSISVLPKSILVVWSTQHLAAICTGYETDQALLFSRKKLTSLERKPTSLEVYALPTPGASLQPVADGYRGIQKANSVV